MVFLHLQDQVVKVAEAEEINLVKLIQVVVEEELLQVNFLQEQVVLEEL